MKAKKVRKLKVYLQNDSQRVLRPTIILKGEWLYEWGFEEGVQFIVVCEEGKLTVLKEDSDEARDYLSGEDSRVEDCGKYVEKELKHVIDKAQGDGELMCVAEAPLWEEGDADVS